MHVLLIEGREPVAADQPGTLLDHAAGQLTAAGDSLDVTQQRSLRVLGTAVTRSGKVVRIEALTVLVGNG